MKLALVHKNLIDPSEGGGASGFAVIFKTLFPDLRTYTSFDMVDEDFDAIFFVGEKAKPGPHVSVFVPTNCIVRKYAAVGKDVEKGRAKETKWVASANLIFTWGSSSCSDFREEYPSFKDKIVNVDLRCVSEGKVIRLFHERNFDFIAAATDWNRQIKGYPTIQRCAKILKDKKFFVLGKGVEDAPENIHCAGLVPSKDITKYMNKAKVILVPSLYDTGPMVAVEAWLCGCNVLVSPECGISREMNAISIATPEEFPERAVALLEKPGLTTMTDVPIKEIRDTIIREITKRL